MTDVADVLGALEGVRDPELDQDLVELGFVTDVEVDGADVVVRLRLPTFYCSPNFSLKHDGAEKGRNPKEGQQTEEGEKNKKKSTTEP